MLLTRIYLFRYLRLHRIPLYIHGFINHGKGVRQLWLHHGTFPKNSNLIFSLLIHHLHSVRDKNGSLPKKLYIQADNASGENKNRWMLAGLCWLVYLGIFKKIVLSFLLVGHTHEDVDQVIIIILIINFAYLISYTNAYFINRCSLYLAHNFHIHHFQLHSIFVTVYRHFITMRVLYRHFIGCRAFRIGRPFLIPL